MAKRRTRSDAKIGTVEKREGFIFNNPDGRNTRSDKLVGTKRREAKRR